MNSAFSFCHSKLAEYEATPITSSIDLYYAYMCTYTHVYIHCTCTTARFWGGWCPPPVPLPLLRYSNVKYTPRVPLILLTFEKRECKNFDFALSFIALTCNSKLYSIYEWFAHHTGALLSRIFLYLVRAACELRLVSYGSKHVSWCLSDTPFCPYLHAQLKK